MRKLLGVMMLMVVTACSAPITDLGDRPDPMGNFQLGFVVTRALDPMAKGPLSRTATREDWMATIQPAMEERFKRFDGSKFFHIGITAGGYVLAKPGVPLVLSPKSVLIFEVVVIDDATGKLLNKEPKQLTVIETLSGGSLIGSGYTKTAEEQMVDLSRAAARAVENWMRGQPWFGTYKQRSAADTARPVMGRGE